MTYAEYLNTMTVKTLREIAAQMHLTGLSRTRKADLIIFIDSNVAAAHEQAENINPVNTEIQFGTGWNCCAAKPVKVIVFENGARWAVCKSCASVYQGEVQDLPVDTTATPAETVTEAPDFQVVLTTALDNIRALRKVSKRVLATYTYDAPQYDAAFQVCQDLDRAYGEMTRTQYMITEGLI